MKMLSTKSNNYNVLCKLKNNFECNICGGLATSRHFGAQACKACAAFFRRTIVGKRYYLVECNKKCELTVGENMCKYCRYKKCLENGMEASLVASKPTIIILNNNTETSNVSIHSFLKSYNSIFQTRKFVVNMNFQLEQESHLPSVTENAMKEKTVFEQFLLFSGLIEHFDYTTHSSRRVFSTWCILNFLHNTYQRDGISQKKFYNFDNTYINWTQQGLINWYGSDKHLAEHRHCIERVAAPMWNKVAEIIKHFQDLKLTNVEIACFFVLTMGQSIIQHSIKPRETRRTVSLLFNEVFKGLNKYYQENYKSFEFAIRMGQVLTFLPLFTEMDAIMNEHFHQLRLCSTEKNRKSFVFFDPEMEKQGNRASLVRCAEKIIICCQSYTSKFKKRERRLNPCEICEKIK